MIQKILRFALAPLILLALTLLPDFTFASEAAEASHGGHGIVGGGLSLLWAVPFAGLLLSIAILPLINEEWWHHNFGKVSAAWALLLVVPMIITFGFETTLFLNLQHNQLFFLLLLALI